MEANLQNVRKTQNQLLLNVYFNPEAIIGKSVRYAIASDASHKFERNTDPSSHEYVLRRFLKIVEKHTRITNVELYKFSEFPTENKYIPCTLEKITEILGSNINKNDYVKYLTKLGFMLTIYL